MFDRQKYVVSMFVYTSFKGGMLAKNTLMIVKS